MNQAQFMQKYRSLTPNQRTRTVVTIELEHNTNIFETPYNWNQMFNEVIRKTQIGKQLLEKLQ
ncbi:MAG: hypothetical protein WC444_06600 [Candidatus Paceibacterota bacterium]